MKALSRERLTWDARSPAPYESMWAIFLKLMALNCASPATLYSVITHSNDGLSPAGRLNCADSAWIDFERFAGLLNVEERRLRNGFLDQLGLSVKKRSKPGIRLCPECWKAGYHCSLFELTVLSHCPWHRCALGRRCERCLAAVTSRGFRHVGARLTYLCDRCTHFASELTDDLILTPLDVVEQAKISRWCNAILGWWWNLKHELPERDAVLTDIIATGEDDDTLMRQAWQLGYAETRTGIPSPHAMGRRKQMAALMTWTESGCHVNCRKRMPLQEAWGCCYRSIRRHIYRRYIRPHHVGCCAALKPLCHSEMQAIDSDAVCTASLAYLIWRMAIEDAWDMAELSRDKTGQTEIRLICPRGERFLDSQSIPRWLLAGFFWIWGELDKRCGQENFYVWHGERACIEIDLVWNTGKRLTSVPGEMVGTGWLFYPSKDDLVAKAKRKCTGRHRSVMHTFDPTRLWNATTFSWARFTPDPKRMFAVKRSTPGAGQIYGAICV
jgi:hypothetical protein